MRGDPGNTECLDARFSPYMSVKQTARARGRLVQLPAYCDELALASGQDVGRCGYFATRTTPANLWSKSLHHSGCCCAVSAGCVQHANLETLAFLFFPEGGGRGWRVKGVVFYPCVVATIHLDVTVHANGRSCGR